MNNLKISTRLLILICAMSALLVVIGAIGLMGISQSNAALRTVYEDRTVPLVDLGLVIDMVNRVRTNAVVASNTTESTVAKQAHADTLGLDVEIDKLWSKYMATALTPQEKILADTYSSQLKAYRISRDFTLTRAMEGNFAAARDNAVKDAGPKFSVRGLAEIQENFSKKQPNSLIFKKLLA